METCLDPLAVRPDGRALQARFLALVPRIERHARIYFRDVRCAARKADCIAETLALAWRWFLRLVQRGKDVTQFVSTFASLAARAVRSGRRVCGQENGKDVLSPLAQRRGGFEVESLSREGSQYDEILEEALHDNVRTPPPEAAAFRIDFPRWLTSWCLRDQRLIANLIVGERTLDVAGKYRLSPGRVSQLRRQFCSDWTTFCGDDESSLRPGLDAEPRAVA
jgi:DNA-directed RNA polymerase specialized sigma24 family protein